MIYSLLDTDLYKLTMGQFAFHHGGARMARYQFTCRNATAKRLLQDQRNQSTIANVFNEWTQLRFQPDELDYLATCAPFSADYLAFLKDFRPGDGMGYEMGVDEKGDFTLEIFGRWDHAIFAEVPFLAMLNEVCLDGKGTNFDPWRNLYNKIDFLKGLAPEARPAIVEFGTRRRYSRTWQQTVVEKLAQQGLMAGTSNIRLSRVVGLPCVGTMAHEYLQAWQALSSNLEDFQLDALEAWLKEWNGQMGIALTDVVGTPAFLKDFGLHGFADETTLAQDYQGVRHDSGDPFAWGEQMLAFYHADGIDPRTKTAVWSDGLSVKLAAELHTRFTGRFGKCLFGIGTHLTNDCGCQPLDGVIKLVELDGKPVAKLSDVPGKSAGSPAMVQRLRGLFMPEAA
jgi:nicotinate phosphoribosyltransferase